MRKIGSYKGFPCYTITLREYEENHEDAAAYVVCNSEEGFDVNKPRNYAVVLNGMKIAVWDGWHVQECQKEEFAISGFDLEPRSKIEKTEVDADRGHENGIFSEYSVVVDEFFKNLES